MTSPRINLPGVLALAGGLMLFGAALAPDRHGQTLLDQIISNAGAFWTMPRFLRWISLLLPPTLGVISLLAAASQFSNARVLKCISICLFAVWLVACEGASLGWGSEVGRAFTGLARIGDDEDPSVSVATLFVYASLAIILFLPAVNPLGVLWIVVRRNESRSLAAGLKTLAAFLCLFGVLLVPMTTAIDDRSVDRLGGLHVAVMGCVCLLIGGWVEARRPTSVAPGFSPGIPTP